MAFSGRDVLILSLSKDEDCTNRETPSWFDKLTMRNSGWGASMSPPSISQARLAIHRLGQLEHNNPTKSGHYYRLEWWLQPLRAFLSGFSTVTGIR